MSFFKRLSTYLDDAKKLGFTWRDLLRRGTRQNVINDIQRYRNDQNMNYLKELSTYLDDAKILGYTWLDLLRKATRQKVINEVMKNRFNKAIRDAKKDLIDYEKNEL